MKFYWDNVIEDATLTTLTVGELAAGENLDDLKIPQLKKDVKFTGFSSYTITMDFQSATSLSNFIIDVGDIPETAALQLYGSASFAAGYSLIDTFTRTETAYFADFTSVSHRYYRLVIQVGSVQDITFGYIQTANQVLNMPPMSPNAKLTYTTTSGALITMGRSVFGNRGQAYIDSSFNFPQIPDTTENWGSYIVDGKTEILEMWEDVENIVPGWLFIWEQRLTQEPPVFGVINSNAMTFDYNHNKGNWNMDFSFTQTN